MHTHQRPGDGNRAPTRAPEAQGRPAPLRILVGILVVGVFAACASAPGEEQASEAAFVGADPGDPADQLASRLRPPGQAPSPITMALATQDAPARPVLTLTATRAMLATAQAAPAVEALRAAGLSDDEIAEMVTMAGAYNSGTPADPARARHAAARARFDKDTGSLEQAITQAEKASGIVVDRARLGARLYGPNDGAYGSQRTGVVR